MKWQADWIWARDRQNSENCYIYARKQFNVEALSDTELSIACLSAYRVYINGRLVGRGRSTRCSSHIVFDHYDLRAYLRPGPNVIGVICYNSGLLPQCWVGGLIAQIDNADHHEPIDASDSTWRVIPANDWIWGSELVSRKTGYQEIYDSRNKPVGWNIVGFDDSRWEEPVVIDCIKGALIGKAISNLSETELRPACILGCDASIKHCPDLLASACDVLTPVGNTISLILDFSRWIVGYPEFRVNDSSGGSVELSYPKTDAGISDRVILHGGRQEWQTFSRRSFRYLKLTFSDLPAPIRLGCVTAHESAYPKKQAWRFECSDDILTKAYANCAQALGRCMQSCYERDPQSDPFSYPTELYIQSLLNFYSYADIDLAASDLREYARALSSDASGRYFSPEQLICWVLALHQHYLYVGDKYLVDDLYDHLKEIIDERLAPRAGASGLLLNSNNLAYAAWNAPYYQALRDASKLAIALGKFDDSMAWHEKAQAVLDAYNSRFWDSAAESYRSASGTDENACRTSIKAGILSVAFGLADTTRQEHLCKSVKDYGRKLGINFGIYTLKAMASMGMINESLDLIRTRWANDSAVGTTGRCAAPVWFLPAEILGIKPSTPHSASVVIQPKTGDLEWARGGYDLPTSHVYVDWMRTEGGLTIEIDAPDRFALLIPTNGFRNPTIHEIDLTPETPERRARKTYGWGDTIWRDGRERDPYLDWLQTQEAEPPGSYNPKSRCDLQNGGILVREPISDHVRYIVEECE